MEGYGRAPTRDDTDVIGARIVAQIIDQIIIFFVLISVIILFSFIGAAGSSATGAGDTAMGGLVLLGYLVAFLLVIGYFLLLEGLWDGYTVGKKLLGIKVVKEDGSSCNMGAPVIRNLLRLIDSFFYYAVGFIFMASSDKRQRLGDKAASTVVIKEP